MGARDWWFGGTFTKFHVLGLLKFSKILVLDFDMVVLECLDHLFDLKAPAIICHGANDRTHGNHIDGRLFFLGGDDPNADPSECCWCQGEGINACAMLLNCWSPTSPSTSLH
jgi:lipopolysaccharide biosynthesis glycosyltransferase